MKRYITSRESASVVVSTMAVTGKKIVFGLFRSPQKKFPKEFGTYYGEYCVLFLCELFAFVCNAKNFTISFHVFSLFLACH